METQVVLILKGTSVCPSERGHNNFYYPKHDKCTILTEDVRANRLHWVGGGDLTAYKVAGQNNIIWAEKESTVELNGE